MKKIVNKIRNDINGMIVLDKPKDYTSNDCLAKIKSKIHPMKIGHTGTLDPNATGVLVCLLGNATKCQDYLMSYGNKVYEADLILGLSTTTEDITGDILFENKSFSIDKYSFINVIESFKGTYNQIPPMYSAKKVNGKKLLNYALKGDVVDRKPCKVTINNISILSNLPDYISFNTKIRLSIECSKGTYIRTLCKDIGDKLGVPAIMGDLRRVKSGDFDINDSISLYELLKKVDENDYSFIKPCFYQKNDSVVTFGKFETLHKGHKLLIDKVVELAKINNIKSSLMIIGKNDDSEIITKEQRISKIKYLGIDSFYVFELNDYSKNILPEDFIINILIKQLKAKYIVVGDDCSFGKGGIGDKNLLIKISKKYDVKVIVIEKLKVKNTDTYISSTLVKEEFRKDNKSLLDELL